MTTPQPTIYRRNDDGTWHAHDLGVELTEFDISGTDVATTAALTEWIADYMRANPGQWYATFGDVESAVVTIDKCASAS